MTKEKPMTFEEFVKELQTVLKEHPEAANKRILIPIDEEGNGYHELLQPIVVDPLYISMALEVGFVPDWARYDNCVIIG